MSMFTLATFCLITSNLPWFMDLIFQVLMQYCSLQHWTWLSPPATSTTGHRFCFGSASLFLLELFLHSSPIAYWAPTNLRASSFTVISFCLLNIKYVSENSCKIFLFFFFYEGQPACGIFVPWPGIKLTTSAVKAQNLSHWTTREVP